MMTVAAHPSHILPLLARLGAAEVALVNARSGIGAVTEIAGSLRASGMTWCGLDADGPVTLGGVIPMQDGSGMVWQVVAPAPVLRLHKRAYVQQGRVMLRQAMLRHGRLFMLIRVSYGAALRHAARLGFVETSRTMLVGVQMSRCERIAA